MTKDRWIVREDEVTGGLTIESEDCEDVFINICPEALWAVSLMQSKNVYVDADDRRWCYLFEFPRLAAGPPLMKVTKLHWIPGSARDARFRFLSYYEFEGEDVHRIVEEALRLGDDFPPPDYDDDV